MLSRRSMLSQTAIAVSAFAMSKTCLAQDSSTREFTLDLRCGSIGVKANQVEAIELAAKHGFESVNAEPAHLAKLSAAERRELIGQLKEHELVWGAAGLPVEFRRDEATFRGGAQNLPKLAAALQDAGVTRVGTYLMPCHNELTYTANLRQHARRLRECAKILADHGQRLGLEYVGPKTLWTSRRYPFVHCMAETKDLIDEIGENNVGFVLDSWHWFTADESVDDLKALSNKDIVACDLNDAPKGKSLDEQIDNQRELPSATGVIDLKSFLQTLVAVGYDGPIRAEPFNQSLNAMDNDQAVAATAAAMKKSFALVES